MFHHHRKCRACESTDLVPVLDLGVQPLANDFQTKDAECAGYAPLKVLFCRNCTLAQLSVVVRPEILYANYNYVTSTSQTMLDHFHALLKDVSADYPNAKTLLEIGSNNGEFLLCCREFGYDVTGVEPAQNLCAIAWERGVKTINRLFDTPLAIDLGMDGHKFDVILARHVFAHIDDWKGFVHALQFVTHEDSLVVIEVPWVVDMLGMQSWDQIYHEHLSFVSREAVESLLEGTYFRLSGVKLYDIHGGSIAFFIKRGPETFPIILPKVYEKAWLFCYDEAVKMQDALALLLKRLKREDRKVCGFGASAKATVWINSIPESARCLSFVCDSTPQKQGKIIPGTDIPIVPEQRLMEADYAIDFAWNFHAEIAAKHKAFTDKGGKWIIPVPHVHIEP